MLEPTSLSPQLNRLVERGYLEKTERSDGKTSWQVAERFFNIWYLMRHGNRRVKQKFRWLVAFLLSFFTQEELRRQSRDIAGRTPRAPEEVRYLLALGEAVDEPALKRALKRRATVTLLSLDRSALETIALMDDLDAEARKIDEVARKVRAGRCWPREEADEFFELLRRSGRNHDERREIISRLGVMGDGEIASLRSALQQEAEARWKSGLPPEIAAAVDRAIVGGALSDPYDIANAETAVAMMNDESLLAWRALTEHDKAFVAKHRAAIRRVLDACEECRPAEASYQMGRLEAQYLERPEKAESLIRAVIQSDPRA